MKTPAPILVADLFPEVRQQLLSLFGGLTAEDWLRPTAAGKWDVDQRRPHARFESASDGFGDRLNFSSPGTINSQAINRGAETASRAACDGKRLFVYWRPG
jgi:hypothetical protein